MPFCVLQFVLFGRLPRAILGAPVRAFWWVASCHFACSSSCFLVGCLVPLWLLQFVLFGGLPRALLRAPVRALWWVASCHFACSSLREQLGRTIAQAAKNGALRGGLWLNFAISLVLIFVLCLVLTVTANRLVIRYNYTQLWVSRVMGVPQNGWMLDFMILYVHMGDN